MSRMKLKTKKRTTTTIMVTMITEKTVRMTRKSPSKKRLTSWTRTSISCTTRCASLANQSERSGSPANSYFPTKKPSRRL